MCGARTGGGSVRSKKSVYEYVFGYTWRLDTNHVVIVSSYSWYPSLTIYATPAERFTSVSYTYLN